MIAPLVSTVVMPTWVFLFIFLGGAAFIGFLMWANDEARHDRDLRRLAKLTDRELVRDSDGIVWLLPRTDGKTTVPAQRTAGDQS